MTDPHLISVHELRAAGALDVPTEWRKSLGAAPVKRDLFSGLSDDEEPSSDEERPAPADTDGNERADEHQ